MVEFPFKPISTRSSLKTIEEGQKGWWVAALQINLNDLGFELIVDGVFGPKTKAKVIVYQKEHAIEAEGKVGPITSRAICLDLTLPIQRRFSTPLRLAEGILEGESGNDIACVSDEYENGSRDVSAWQKNIIGWSESSTLFIVFNVRLMAIELLRAIRDKHDEYVGRGCNNKVAWQLATLHHNRPSDADQLSRASSGLGNIAWLTISDKPGWFTIGGVSYSRRQWLQKYISDKTKYVDWALVKP